MTVWVRVELDDDEPEITHHRGKRPHGASCDEPFSFYWADPVGQEKVIWSCSEVRCWLHHSPLGRHVRKGMKEMHIRTLAALSMATSARPRKTSQGATRPEAGNSPSSSSSSSEESPLVRSEVGGNVRFVAGGADMG